MKANKSPEKIYLQEPTKVRTEKKYDNDVEYTRTDAFIEKAFEFFGEHLWEYIDVKNANCDTFINIDGDKLKEDFKNYMEENKVCKRITRALDGYCKRILISGKIMAMKK